MFGPFDLLLPPIVLITAILTLPFTLGILAIQGRFNAFTNWSELRHTWFKHFWFWFGPATKPMFAGRVRSILAQAKGTVLEIGPASGIWMREFGQAVKAKKVTKIYGVEPNVKFHQQLRSGAARWGLADIYQPLPVYAQDLGSCGVKKGSVDTIVTVHVLCSVGGHAETLVKELYEYLKPGGQWLVYEHVASEQPPVRLLQEIQDKAWVPLLDGCSLCKDTMDVLRRAGEWESVDIQRDPSDGYFQCLPHVYGRLVKAS